MGCLWSRMEWVNGYIVYYCLSFLLRFLSQRLKMKPFYWDSAISLSIHLSPGWISWCNLFLCHSNCKYLKRPRMIKQRDCYDHKFVVLFAHLSLILTEKEFKEIIGTFKFLFLSNYIINRGRPRKQWSFN